jgi:tripartite ATP-independent transporter DctM subunit
MRATGMGLLALVAVLLIASGLPAWIVVVAVALGGAGVGTLMGAFDPVLLGAIPGRLVGLLENDLLQALPLFVLMGSLLNRLPLADAVFATLRSAWRRTGAGASLAGVALAVLLAPLCGSVGASASLLGRTVAPRLRNAGVGEAGTFALVTTASTLGVVVPPSLVLILLGDALMRAHTEALNVTGKSVRIVNTQDLFAGALLPAALLLCLCALIAWRTARSPARTTDAPATPPSARERVTAWVAIASVAALLAAVTLGYLYAVEAAATGALACAAYGIVTRTLTRATWRRILDEAMALTGALFAVLVAASVFSLVFRGFGTDRWLAEVLASMPGGEPVALAAVLGILAACALVLDAFEILFVVIPVVMPPLLTVVEQPTWAGVLALLVLQLSFMMPPFGYAVVLTRQAMDTRLPARALARGLRPYVVCQVIVLALVLAVPALVWQRTPLSLGPSRDAAPSEDEGRRLLEQQLAPPPEPEPEPTAPR